MHALFGNKYQVFIYSKKNPFGHNKADCQDMRVFLYKEHLCNKNNLSQIIWKEKKSQKDLPTKMVSEQRTKENEGAS